uniref:Lipid-binding serum glycoprotein N-terminal domain-containing protein n=1 Tax=Strongyloides venezuelensis TaxID=75913 RepID=A0A0K0FJU4_STRVS
MIYPRLLDIFLTIFLTFYQRNDNGDTIPSTQIQFSSVGLNYMAGVAIDYINSAIAEVNMPDIEGLLKFTYHFSQIKIEEFNIPKSSNAFQFSPPNKLGINLQGISRKMSTHYQVKIKEGVIHLTNLRIFDIKLHGSLPDDKNDLFRKEIKKHFKEKIEVICQVIEKVESDQGNKILGSFPLDIRLTGTFKGFHIDYPLTSNPESSTISFTISIEDLIYYEGHRNDLKIPKPNYVIHPYNTNKCRCIDFESDRVLDSAAYAFEFSNLSQFMIDDNILKLFQQSIRNFFQCSCIVGLCIGELITEKFHFNSTSKYVNATGNVKFRTATLDGFMAGTERKVLQKYYPPDFDGSLASKIRKKKSFYFMQRATVLFNMQCNT